MRALTTRVLPPWPILLVLSLACLGIVWLGGTMLRTQAQNQLDCEAQRAYNWQTMPDMMARMQAEADARRARLQAALDAQRATSWWAWLTLPARPKDLGCTPVPL